MTFSLSSIRPALGTASGTYRPARPRTSLMAAFTIWKERRELARMDVSRLKDLGISPRAAAIEAARPFWDLPTQSCR